jgi:hypothetical protein
MINSIFALLLVPLFPGLADPDSAHGPALQALESKLAQGRSGLQAAGQDVGNIAPGKELLLNPPALPLITGRIFGWSSKTGSDQFQPEADFTLVAESLRLTGMIESSGQRVAIVNDGQKDHVLALGSYLMNTYQVTSVGPGKLVLLPVSAMAGAKKIELNMAPQNGAGGLQ